MSRTPWRLALLAGLFVAGFALVAASCGGDDDSNGATSPTAQGNGDGTASPTMQADGVGADLEQRFNDLKDRFGQASEDTQQRLQDLRNEVEQKYNEWETATADERDKLAQEFNDLADQLKNALDEAG